MGEKPLNRETCAAKSINLSVKFYIVRSPSLLPMNFYQTWGW